MRRALNSIPVSFHACLLALVSIALLLGWFTPTLYELSGAEQTRWTYRAMFLFWGKFVAAGLAWGMLPWVDFRGNDTSLRKTKLQFGTRLVLIFTMLSAVVITLLRLSPQVVSVCLVVFAYIAAAYCAFKYPSYRMPIAALLLVMLLPFCWVWTSGASRNGMQMLLASLGALPAFFCRLVVGWLSGLGPHNAPWLAVTMTGMEILVGLWIICRCGPKLTVAYLIGALLCALTGSMILDAGARI